MVAKDRALFGLLVVACSFHTLNAWPWSKTTTTTTSLPWVTRAELLATATASAEQVKDLVQQAHSLTQTDDVERTIANALVQLERDVDKWLQTYVAEIIAYKKEFDSSLDFSACTARFEDDLAEGRAMAIEDTKETVDWRAEDLRNSSVGLDAPLDAIAAVVQLAQDEAAKPDGKYGPGAEAILEELDSVVHHASWKVAHIKAMYEYLTTDDFVHFRPTDAQSDIDIAIRYAGYCMRRVERHQASKQ